MTLDDRANGDAGRSPDRRPRANVIVSWIVIVAAIAYVSGSYFVQAGHQGTAEGDPAQAPSIRLKMAGRYIVGARHLLAGIGVKSRDSDRKLLEAIEDEESDPVDRLRTIPVAGDVSGSQAAIQRLDQIEPKLPAALEADAKALRTIYTQGPDHLSPEQRASLIERHGWFAQLALASGRPPEGPEARAAYAPAVRAFVAQVGIVVVALGLLSAGVVLFLLAVAWLKRGRIQRAYKPSSQPADAFLEAFAIYLGGFVGLPLLLRRFFPEIPTGVIVTAAVLPVALAAVWPLLSGVGLPAWRDGLGFFRGAQAPREIAAGLLGYIAGTPVLAIGIVLTIILSKIGKTQATHPIVQWVGRGGAGRILGLYLLACVWAPLTEETLFRGAFFHHLRYRHGWLLSSAIVSTAFAAVHPQGWAAFPFLASVAMVLAAVREWRGTIIASAAAHALNNGLAMTFMVLALS